ncbi:MAG: NAD(P)-dependent glycerol-1-phosphate dehydrogenase [Candidatus Ranarchaeia archaeon]
MSAHFMQLPREVILGANILDLVGEIAKKLGMSGRALIVTGKTTYNLAGRTVENSLATHGFEVDCVFVEKPTYEEVEKTREVIRESGNSFALGVGGGKNIDIAKLSSSLENIPFFSVPTVASHDGIASTNASLQGSEYPYSSPAQTPIAVIGDTEIIHQSPYRFLAAGCGDIIANWTAVKDWQLGRDKHKEYYGEYAASLSKMSAIHLMENVSNVVKFSNQSVRLVLEALISTGVAMGIAGSSRPASGSEHMFSHALDRLAPNIALHGEQCGIATIIMEYLHGGDWQKIQNSLQSIGAPSKAKEIGIPANTLVEALVLAKTIRPERYSILNEKEIDAEVAETILEETGIIG